MADKMANLLKTKYKDELNGVPEHFINTVTQNHILKCKDGNGDISTLMDELGI
jgi:hypothetical protein